jgi:hypothetical protein
VQPVATSPDEHIASQPEQWREAMAALDATIVAAMPGRCRVLWEGVFWGGTEQRIIGYGDLVQPRPRGDDVEWFVVGLAGQSKHLSVYVNAVDDGRYLGQHYADRLGKVKVGSASIAIRRLDDLDLGVFAEMIGRAHELTPPDR